jgi:hypothetical protein
MPLHNFFLYCCVLLDLIWWLEIIQNLSLFWIQNSLEFENWCVNSKGFSKDKSSLGPYPLGSVAVVQPAPPFFFSCAAQRQAQPPWPTLFLFLQFRQCSKAAFPCHRTLQPNKTQRIWPRLIVPSQPTCYHLPRVARHSRLSLEGGLSLTENLKRIQLLIESVY